MLNMVLMNRRGFVKGAAACCIGLVSLDATGFDGATASEMLSNMRRFREDVLAKV